MHTAWACILPVALQVSGQERGCWQGLEESSRARVAGNEELLEGLELHNAQLLVKILRKVRGSGVA